MQGFRFGVQAAGGFPETHRLFTFDEGADLAVLAPLPCLHERPREILERIAEMRHLPIEDSEDTVFLVQEIAATKVAVDDADALRRRRRVIAQPADAGTDDRLRLQLVAVDDPFPVIQLAAPATGRLRNIGDLERGKAGNRRRRDVGENAVHALRQTLTVGREARGR